MRVAFVVNDLHLSGGVSTIVEHAARLRLIHGFDVDLVSKSVEQQSAWDYEQLAHVRVRTFDEALAQHYDVALATWWETTTRLFEIPADRHAYFVQSLEDRFYTREHRTEAFAASLTYDLPVSFITEARWIARAIGRMRPEAPRFYVRNGIDKHVFEPPDETHVRLDGPLRVLIEGRPDVWFKGVGEALEATRAMTQPRYVTLVSPSSPSATGPDRILGPLTSRELAEVYRETDVVLKLSRVEGMYGPPLEGFHLGTTCVTTPVTGHDEYVIHGWNGLVVDWDDTVGTARSLDLLARDRRMLHYLRTNALNTARAWPSWDQSSDFMALILRRIARGPTPRAAAAGRSLARVRVELEQRTAFPSTGRTVLAHMLVRRASEGRLTSKMLGLGYRKPFRRPLEWVAARLLG